MGRAIINTGFAKLVPRDRAFGAFWTAKPNGGIPDAVIAWENSSSDLRPAGSRSKKKIAAISDGKTDHRLALRAKF